MAKIIIFGKLDRESGLAWERCNGATRPLLRLHIADGITLDHDAQSGFYTCRGVVSAIENNNAYALHINPEPDDAKRELVLHIVLNDRCGFDVYPEDAALWDKSSWGGPKNSRSQFAVVKPHAYIAIHTYKHSTPRTYYFLHKDGVRRLGQKDDILAAAIEGSEVCRELVRLMGWEVQTFE